MSSLPIEPNEHIRLLGIQTLALDTRFDPLSELPEKFEFMTDWEVIFDAERQLVALPIEVKITSPEVPDCHVYQRSNFVFEVAGLNKVVDFTQKPNPGIDPQFLFGLISITFSTLRGVLHGQLRGTAFHHATLPLMSQATLQQLITDHQSRRKPPEEPSAT